MTSSSPRSGRQAEDEEVEATFRLADRRTEGALTTTAWLKHFCRVSQILLVSRTVGLHTAQEAVAGPFLVDSGASER
eukprot:4243467-Prymnesium_polylepis.1